MSMTIHVDIVSAEESIYSGLAEMVYASGELGELGIAPRHAPLITRLKPGEVRLDTGSEELAFYISGGILEVQPADKSANIDFAKAQAELAEAAAQLQAISRLRKTR